ncbi:MAG: DUF5674 family protein [Cyanobacteria bacterium P01_F01_bin.150]
MTVLIIHIIRVPATPKQMRDMLDSLGVYIKLAVDVELGILAGGGELHVDCEQTLLDECSEQANVWGADWYPFQQRVDYESIINFVLVLKIVLWRFKMLPSETVLIR